ncbi:MAG: hypothetical protein R3F04_11220 [Lysobacteraceae bacterium]
MALEDLVGHLSPRRLIEDAMGIRRLRDEFGAMSVARECLRAIPSAEYFAERDAVTMCARDMCSSQGFADQLAQFDMPDHLGSLAAKEYQAGVDGLLDQARVAQTVIDQASAACLSAETCGSAVEAAGLLRALHAHPADVLYAQNGDFLRDATGALEYLQQIDNAALATFGGDLAIKELHRQIEAGAFPVPWHELSVTPFRDAWNDVDERADERHADNASACAEEIGTATSAERKLASRCAPAQFELEIRLRSVASRLDHAALGDKTGFDEQIRLVATYCLEHALQEHGVRLVILADKLSKALRLMCAPRGSARCGGREQLSDSDVEEFVEIMQAICKILRMIEHDVSE